jgi:hypothetical protein
MERAATPKKLLIIKNSKQISKLTLLTSLYSSTEEGKKERGESREKASNFLQTPII